MTPKSCGDISNQDNALSAKLNAGEMRIMLKWKKTDPITAIDLDAHISLFLTLLETERFTYFMMLMLQGCSGQGCDYLCLWCW